MIISRQKQTCEKGSVLLLTVLVMSAVAVLGTLSICAGIVELEIARDESELRQSFFLAESAEAEALQRLLNSESIDLAETFAYWHHTRKEMENEGTDFRRPDHWRADGLQRDNAMPGALDQDTFMAAVEWEVAPGESLIVTEPRYYMNRIYGLCRKYSADNLVEIGFKLRY